MKDSFAPSILINPSRIIDGINIYDRNDYNEWYEVEYDTGIEPWGFSHRGAELYRHVYSVQKIKQYNAHPQALLELGCSKGLMTELLIDSSHTICAADVSLTALKACSKRCTTKAKQKNCQVDYFVTTTPHLPFAPNSFDVVTLCDGLAEWYSSDEQKQLALKDVHRVLKRGGIAILTDCLMPEQNKGAFELYEALIHDSPLAVVEISFLYDKPWYKFETLLKKAGLASKMRNVLASVTLAKALNSAGRLFGRKASRHIVIIVRKE